MLTVYINSHLKIFHIINFMNTQNLICSFLLMATAFILLSNGVVGQLRTLNLASRHELSKGAMNDQHCQISSKFYFTTKANDYLLSQEAQSEKVIVEMRLGQTNCKVTCGHRDDQNPYVGAFCRETQQVKLLQHFEHSNVKKTNTIQRVRFQREEETSELAIGGGNIAAAYIKLGVIDVFRIGRRQERQTHTFQSEQFHIFLDIGGNLLILAHDALYICINPLGNCKMCVIEFYSIFIPNFKSYPELDFYKNQKEGHRISYKLTLPRRNFRFYLQIDNSLTSVFQEVAYGLPGKIKSSEEYFVHYQTKVLNFFDEKTGKYLFEPQGLELDQRIEKIQLAKGSDERKVFILTKDYLLTVGQDKNSDVYVFVIVMALGIIFLLGYVIWSLFCASKEDYTEDKQIELTTMKTSLYQEPRQNQGAN